MLLDGVPSWMSYLLCFGRDSRSWVLYVSTGGCLAFCDQNWRLTRAHDRARAKRWAEQLDAALVPHAPAVVAWRHVIVDGRTGWTSLHDPGWAANRRYHQLHPAIADRDACCAWPAVNGGQQLRPPAERPP